MLDWEDNTIEKRNRTKIMLYDIEVDAMTAASEKVSAF